MDTKDNNNILLRKIRLIHSYKNIENESYIYDIITNLLNEINWININIDVVRFRRSFCFVLSSLEQEEDNEQN